jgi:hypothetical protein
MKLREEAREQYRALALALREIGVGWVVDEVEDVANRGKTVTFDDLPAEEIRLYEERVDREETKGIRGRRARANDEVGVPLGDSERLSLLADAANRLIQTSVRANAYVSDFAERNRLSSVVFEVPRPSATDTEPVVLDQIGSTREVPLVWASDLDEPLRVIENLLRGRVVD